MPVFYQKFIPQLEAKCKANTDPVAQLMLGRTQKREDLGFMRRFVFEKREEALGDAAVRHIAGSYWEGILMSMNNTTTRTKKAPYSAAELVLDRDARLEARRRVVGLWRGKVKVMIADARKLRREWDKRLAKL